MSKFIFYTSLTPKAKQAFDMGDGKHGKFVVDSGHIAYTDRDGRSLDFHKVIKGTVGEPITEVV